MARETAQIPFVPNQESGSHKLGGSSPLAMNVIMEPNGTVRRRPAIVAGGFTTSVVDADGITGLHATVGGKVYAVGGAGLFRDIYRVGAGSVSLTGTNAERLYGASRPVFAETEALVVIAAGQEPQKIVLSSDACSRLGGSPNKCSHIIANASRLLTNDVASDLSKVRYSDVDSGLTYAGHETWSLGVGTAGFFSGEARPDPVVALRENTNEAWLFGSTNFELYAPDATYVFARTTAREHGCAAPYSIINFDQAFAFLDHRRRFVISDGRDARVISDAIDSTIGEIDTVDDCYGFRFQEGPADVLAWTFPTDGRTFAYQVGGGWSQWAGYSAANRWSAFPVTAHCYNAVTGQNVVGTSSGRVGALAMGESDDIGGRIVAFVETGYQNRGSDALKHCIGVKLAMELGEGVGGIIGSVRYSDKPGEWSAPLNIVSIADDTNPVVEFRSLGVYRRRAWRFEFSAAVDLALVSATEEYEELEV